MLVILAGHHRSGTSLLAQTMSQAGLFLGDDLLGAGDSNPHGHFEDKEVLAIHDQILADSGRNWQVDEDFVPLVTTDIWERLESLVARRSRHENWGFKDPRVCFFLPLWKHLIPDAKVLVTFRSPAECVDSLERRAYRQLRQQPAGPKESWSILNTTDLGARLWLQSNRALLRAIESYRSDVLLVDFHHLGAGLDVVAAARQRWGIELSSADEVSTFDDQAVTAATEELMVVDDGLRAQVGAVWKELKHLAVSDIGKQVAK